MRCVLWTAAVLLLTACGGAAGQYYHLPDSGFELVQDARVPVLLKVVMPDSLNGESLVYQTSATQVHFTRQHQWSEEPAPAVAKSLANALNSQGGRYRYTVTSEGRGPTLTVHIERFQGQYNGHTRVSGYSQWSDGTPGRNFDIETPQQGDGYDAMVQSLAEGLRRAAAVVVP